jgi:antirestriction protein ArdC
MPRDEDTPRAARLLRLFTVFNVAQIEELPARLIEPEAAIVWDTVGEAEAIISHSGAEIRHGGNAAYYSPGPDRIQLPAKGAFQRAEDYYATVLHELTHYAGVRIMPSRRTHACRVLARRPSSSA